VIHVFRKLRTSFVTMTNSHESQIEMECFNTPKPLTSSSHPNEGVIRTGDAGSSDACDVRLGPKHGATAPASAIPNRREDAVPGSQFMRSYRTVASNRSLAAGAGPCRGGRGADLPNWLRFDAGNTIQEKRSSKHRKGSERITRCSERSERQRWIPR
jgi:hypothetical protein